MSDILINQSVAILCDGNNIERSIHEMSNNQRAMINFDQLIPKLLNGRGLNRLIYFREGKSISEKFAERLHENYYGSVKEGTCPEGVSFYSKCTGSAQSVINELLSGLRSGLTYGGAKNIKELQRKAEFVEVSNTYISDMNSK